MQYQLLLPSIFYQNKQVTIIYIGRVLRRYTYIASFAYLVI